MLKYYKHLYSSWFQIIILIVLSIGYSFTSFAFPWLEKIVYDKLIITYDKNLLVFILFAIFSLVLLTFLTCVAIEILATFIQINLIESIRTDLTRQVYKYSYDFFLKTQSGDIIQRLIPEVRSIAGVISTSIKCVSYFLQIMILLLLIALININVFLIYLALGLLYIFWHLLNKKNVTNSNREFKNYKGKQHSFFYSQFEQIKEIKIFNLYEKRQKELKKNLLKIRQKSLKNSVFGFILSASKFFTELASLAIIVYSFNKMISDGMSLGFYLVFSGFLTMLLMPIGNLVKMGNIFQAGKVSAERIETIVESDLEKSGNVKLSSFKDSIEFQNIHFSYKKDSSKKILNNLSLKINKGEDIAIVGGSGSGKSTIANLMLRLYDPLKGHIMIDQNILNSYEINSIRDKIGLMTQDIFAFNDTIRANIDPLSRHTDTEIRKILKTVQLNKFIDRLDYIVGERGKKISGGEKQRMALARLLIRNCPIIIFDEATSSLDPETEEKILSTLGTVKEDKFYLTTITISHRLNSIVNKDRIYVMENGSIKSHGTHPDLITRCDTYKQLFNL